MSEIQTQIPTMKPNRSESIKELATALSKCQGKMESASKDAANPFFKSRYATLAAVWDACREPMAANGLSVVQLPEVSEECVKLETILMHTSGEYISSTLVMRPVKNDPQGLGSCITYARRYALASVVGVSPEDDDGNGATMPNRKAAPPAKETEQSPPSPAETQSEAAMKVGHIEALCKANDIDLEKVRAFFAENDCNSLADVPDTTIARMERDPAMFKATVYMTPEERAAKKEAMEKAKAAKNKTK